MLKRKYNIPIIYYHSVAPKINTEWVKNYLTLELRYFEEQLKYFVNYNYRFIDLKEYYLHNADEIFIKENAVCLTFDDGYLDNFIYVYPLLKKYNARATIFINPVFIDKRTIIRKTLEDYWNSKAALAELDKWGFLSWDEMRLMEKSGLIDIQSHTLTHTKYFVSDKITGFHHPGADSLYAVSNLYSEKLPYYIEDKNFDKLIPYGYPIFEERSSVIARKVSINQSLIHSITQLLKNQDWSKSFYYLNVFNKVKPVYDEYKRNNAIISNTETEREYKARIYYELKESMDIIERELNKKVSFCCWPHGDNNEFSHKTALKIGYKATSIGKMSKEYIDITRFDRFGLGKLKNSLFLSRMKNVYKIKSFKRVEPYYTSKMFYEYFRDLK